jgi:molybdopterin-containing oxidoreductase family membrane subunit
MSSHEATKPLVIGDKSYHDVTVDVAAVEVKANKHWWIVFSIAFFPLGYSLYNLHRINRESEHGD